MFPAVCNQFANAMGRHTLIPSASIDEAVKAQPLNIATKRRKRKFVFFHKAEYTIYDFPLQNLLHEKDVIQSEIEETPFCSYNPESTYSLNGKFGADILKDIADASLSATDKVTLSAKLGELILRQVKDSDGFMSELMCRKVNLKHPLIKQIQNDKEVILCVVRGVIQTSDKAEIKRTDNTEGSVKLIEKIKGDIDIESGASNLSTRDIILEKGTTLAYKVWELKINVPTGEMLPMVAAGLSGGFSSMDGPGEDSTDGNEPPVLKHLHDLLQPLLDLDEADSQQFKTSILTLMTCPRDAVLLSKLLSEAERSSLRGDKETIDKAVVHGDAVWSLLGLAGIHIEEEVISYERDTSQILTAVAYVVDALSELEIEDLEHVCHCNEKQLKSLLSVLESSITSSMPISVSVDNAMVLEDPVCSILTDLDFTVHKDDNTILPPKTKTSVVECFYCVLYCFK